MRNSVYLIIIVEVSFFFYFIFVIFFYNLTFLALDQFKLPYSDHNISRDGESLLAEEFDLKLMNLGRKKVGSDE